VKAFDTFVNPLVDNNPIAVQILGLCSALAVSRSLRPALIMCVCVTGVLVFSNVAVSLLRHTMPRSIRLVLEITIIASAVMVADEVLKAYAPEVSAVLSVFVALIITNCIVLGRAETFAMHNAVLPSAADAVGNGLGYSILLLAIAAIRELFGSGSLFGVVIWPTLAAGGWYRPNEMMLAAPSAFFIVALLVWGLRRWQMRGARAPHPAIGAR
jgi:Na+-transporting NADH:ubiquinone oxidoreductase subunit D